MKKILLLALIMGVSFAKAQLKVQPVAVVAIQSTYGDSLTTSPLLLAGGVCSWKHWSIAPLIHLTARSWAVNVGYQPGKLGGYLLATRSWSERQGFLGLGLTYQPSGTYKFYGEVGSGWPNWSPEVSFGVSRSLVWN